jgi:hypothetical protein
MRENKELLDAVREGLQDNLTTLKANIRFLLAKRKPAAAVMEGNNQAERAQI